MHAVSVQIIDEGSTPIIGENYDLFCNVTGIDSETFNITDYDIMYRWEKRNITQTQLIGVNSSILLFSQFRLSDLGLYTCQVTIESVHFNEEFNATDSFNITAALHSE